MRASAAALLSLLTLALISESPTSALECYACRWSKDISTVKLSALIQQGLAKFPTCDMMDKEGPSEKFRQTCSETDKGCANIIDPEDANNRVRTCFPLAKDECKKTACYCTGDLCNGAGGALASLVTVASAMLVVLMAC